MVVVAAWLFAACAALVILFQLALVGGAPWGHLTQGGGREGRLPPLNRGAAALSGVLMAASAAVVLAHAGAALPAWEGATRPWMWAVVGLSALTVLANAASRSRAERALWLPIGLVLLATSLLVVLRA